MPVPSRPPLFLSDGVLGSHRQAENGDGVVVVEQQGIVLAVDKAHLVCAVEPVLILPAQGSPMGVSQLNGEAEIRGVIGLAQAAAGYLLADGQFPGVGITGGLVGHDHDIQQAEQVGQLNIPKVFKFAQP